MKTYTKLSIFSLILLSLSVSCGNNRTNKFKGNKFLLSPVGAPTLAIYDEVSKNKEVETTSETTEVSSALLVDNYKYLVFDSTTALKMINNKKSNYKFLKLLTGGNFHLIGINKKEGDLPKKDDFILGFGNENNVPVQAFRKLYSEAINDENNEKKTFDLTCSNITELSTLLKAMNSEGKIGENKIDWVFIAQPALFSLLNTKDESNNYLPFKTLATVDINVKDAFKAKFNTNYIPQAGLFVNQDFYNENEEEVTNFSKNIDTYLNNAIYDVSKVVDSINSFSQNANEQKARFGYTSNIVKALQSKKTVENKDVYSNQFGIVDPSDNYSINDLTEFLNIIK